MLIHETGTVEIHLGDCLTVLRSMPDASVDAVITDPPYAINASEGRNRYLGETTGACEECGNDDPRSGYRLCLDCLETCDEQALMGSPMLGMQSQNWHAKATHSRGYADNDNDQFQQWCLLWARECHRVLKPGGHLVAFGGTRTWHRLACGIEDAGFELRDSLAWIYGSGFPKSLDVSTAIRRADTHLGVDVDGLDPEARKWEGWGTTLKPAHEPIVLARKHLAGTVAATVTAYGTGALNIEGTKIANVDRAIGGGPSDPRWPANVMLDASQARELDGQAGEPVSRFFWVAKPNQNERVRVEGVAHPTVKPLELMRRLVRLVTPPDGTVVDPFAGSGTTVEACLLEGKRVVAIEREPQYLPLIQQRIDRRQDPVRAVLAQGDELGLFDLLEQSP